MNKEFIIDDEFKKLLYIQRHSCRKNRQRVRKHDGEDLYKDLTAVYNLFKAHLPKRVSNVLDVGCGLGYLDVVINDKLSFTSSVPYTPPNFYMFDAMDSFVGGSVKKFYSNLEATKKFMMAHGVDEDNIFLVDASKTGSSNQINKDPECFSGLPKMDLVVSMYSWGWHFRIEKYIKEVSHIMNSGGLLVLEMKEFSYDGTRERNANSLTSNGFSVINVAKHDKRFIVMSRKL